MRKENIRRWTREIYKDEVDTGYCYVTEEEEKAGK